MNKFDLIVIGGGPAGLSCAVEAKRNNANVLIVEREGSLGGILKQCIHDGFGLIRFKEKLSGPEYTERYIDMVNELHIPYLLLSFVTKIIKENDLFKLYIVSKDGILEYYTKSIALATGCRERTSKQVNIHGTRPYGVLTAGCAQNLVNLEGVIPGKNVCILGSGDIGLIMARRLTFEGAKVLGVYEIKSEPSGLNRNIKQCLEDFNIPLHLSTTVTKVFGDSRLEAIEVEKVDKNMKPIEGTKEIIKCDTLILSVGLIPENELGESLGIEIDKHTKGAKCDNNFETTIDGIYTCGNATHVNDLVDYVSESAEIAGRESVLKKNERKLIDINIEGNILYVVPQMIDINNIKEKTIMYFRSSKILENQVLKIFDNDKEIFSKQYNELRPPEMERIVLKLDNITEKSKITVRLMDI